MAAKQRLLLRTPELSTPLGNEPDPTKAPKKDPSCLDGEEAVQEPLEVERLEGRQESGRDD